MCPCDEHSSEWESEDQVLSPLPGSDTVRLREGYFSTGDPEDVEDATIMASIFMHHLHFLHEFSQCSVCESMQDKESEDD